MRQIARRESKVWDHWPLLSQWERLKYESVFGSEDAAGFFRGVYPSQAAALATAPAGEPQGYDHAAAARMYTSRISQRAPSDYPAMLWLQKCFDAGVRRVVDVGGHIGVAFYGYQSLLTFPGDARWTVHDVPAVVERGRIRAKSDDPSGRLAFSDRFEVLDGAELMFASGSLQYLDDEISVGLSRLSSPPRHLLVNQLPVHRDRSFWTLQNIGTSFCAYRVLSESDALGGLRRLGYALIDVWQNPDKSCHIPFHREHCLEFYTGFLMSRQPSASMHPLDQGLGLLPEGAALDGGRSA